MDRNSTDVETSPVKEEVPKEVSEKTRAPPTGPPTDETQYPPAKAVAMILVALYLALFLVALVSPLPNLAGPGLTSIGSNHYIYGDSSYHR
jgi:hypothetical protein